MVTIYPGIYYLWMFPAHSVSLYAELAPGPLSTPVGGFGCVFVALGMENAFRRRECSRGRTERPIQVGSAAHVYEDASQPVR